MATNQIKFTIRGENKSAGVFRQVRSSIKSLSKSLFSFKGALVGALGIAGLGAMAKSVLESGDKIHKLSIRLGVSTEALSQLGHAAGLSGVAFNTLAMGMQRMQRRIAEAAIGTGEAKGAIEELGLSAVALNDMEPEQAFKAVAEAMTGVENESDKMRLAMKLFDSGGVALLQMMEKGAGGIDEMMNSADELGVTLSSAAAQDIADFNDRMGDLKAIVMGVVRDLMLEALPILTDLVETFKDWYAINGDIMKQKFAKVWENITITAKALIPIVEDIAHFFWVVGDAIGWAAAKAADLFDLMNSVPLQDSGSGNFPNMAPASAYGGQSSGAPVTSISSGDAGLTEDEKWAQGAMQQNVYINQQMSRSDVTAVISETARRDDRL